MDIFEIIRRVQRFVKIKDFFGDITPELLTQSLITIAENPWPMPIRLPALKTSASITTSVTVPYVSLALVVPQFHQGIYKATSLLQDGKDLSIVHSEDKFRQYWGDLTDTGDIKDVFFDAQNNRLYYAPVSTTADTLSVFGYTFPTVFAYTETSDFTDIPDQYITKTLCAHAAAEVLILNGALQEATTILDIFKIGMVQLYSHISKTYEIVPHKKTTVGYI